MKFLASAVLVLATTACTAANQAPVNIALDVYRSCLVGFTQARGFPRTLPEIQAQSIELDSICTQWTYAWLPSFLDKNRPTLNFAEDLRFKQRKSAMIAEYSYELTLLLK